MPDFAQVYNFIGSVFDPNSSDHLQKLKTMDPINVETVWSVTSCSVSSSWLFYFVMIVTSESILPGIVIDEKSISQSAKPWIWGTCKCPLLDIVAGYVVICL